MGMFGIDGALGDAVGATASVFAPPIATYFGQQDANEQNRRNADQAWARTQGSAREAMSFEDSQARAQEAFQERMSSTAYQRAAEDAKKAGFNPLVALSGQASSPSGAMASGKQASAQAPDYTSPGVSAAQSSVETAKAISSVLSSVMEAKMFGARAANLQASTKNLNAQAAESGVRARTMTQDALKGDLTQKLYNWSLDTWDQAQKANASQQRQEANPALQNKMRQMQQKQQLNNVYLRAR